ncbi:hypothetical protein [Roseovarius sp. M141]|uniref:hypothetical protein n=1 Tax=Roseovarius sp. M141 TaxID=2583806 RepID=UPI0020CC23D4|nr:hypothetical protein [Roseovarius sp. M141]
MQIFDNTDFGYHKVTIERPDRRRAQFSAERLETLRFDKSCAKPMAHLWAEHGEESPISPVFTGNRRPRRSKLWCEGTGTSP